MTNNIMSGNKDCYLRICPLFFLLFFLILKCVSAQSNKAETELLLSRLKLEKEGLEKVRSASESAEAAKELLSYYKKRQSVNHPVDRNLKTISLGNIATPKDIKVANNALKHVFIGQSAYPPHFCGEDINWSSNPVPDNEWIWQLNRMYFWDAMGRVYWHTGDEKYVEEWGKQLIDWVHKNPNDENHQYAWRSIEAGIRGHSWTCLFQRFIDSPSFSPEMLITFLNSCYDHAEYLMTKYKTGSNWALMEAEGMAFIAITFPEFKDAEKWRTEAFRRFNNEINVQVYPDGHQRELVMGYHVGCIRWFLRTYDMAKMNGLEQNFPTTYYKVIEKMCEIPMKLRFPDGTIPQFGDSWAGKPGTYNDKIKEWAKMFNRDDFLYLATDGQQGHKPDSIAYALPISGLYSMRGDWDKDAICMVLKCGPDGGHHCQPDNGTFSLYAGGRTLMPDGGSYIYHGDPEGRAWFRQTKVHQTLTLNGENSAYKPRLLKWQPGDQVDILVVENESYDDLTHRRSVFFVDKRYFVIVDEAFGSATGNVDIHFQLAPGDAVFNKKELSVHSGFEEGWNVLVQTHKQQDIKLEEEEGQVSFKYTKKEPRPAFRFRMNKKTEKPIRFVTVVVPYSGEVPNKKIVSVKNSTIDSSQFQLEIEKNGKKRKIKYSL